MEKYIECDVAIRDIANRLNITKLDGTPYRKEDIETFVESLVVPIPSADVVDRDCYNRVLKENDTMREQLAKIGKKPGDSMDNVRPVINARKIKFYNNPWTDRKFTTCAACHGKVGPHDKFCKHCGAKFEEAFT